MEPVLEYGPRMVIVEKWSGTVTIEVYFQFELAVFV
jgi:hypothetical protein